MQTVKFDLKSYLSDTVQLSVEEHGIYLLLLFWYYDSESPIPDDMNAIMRRLRLGNEQQQTVTGILKEFFNKTAGAHHHDRCEVELHDFRWQRETRRINGSKSKGRPRKEPVDKKPNRLNKITESIPSRFISATGAEQILPKVNGLQCPVLEIVDLYHEILPELRQCLIVSDKRRQFISSRWKELYVAKEFEDKESGLEWVKAYFEMVKRSKFLTGKNDSGWKADLEWLFNSSNFVKTVEGKYK
jgi:uncharacterized protein YdaU (DUF1376 family)